MITVWRLIAHHEDPASVINLIRTTGQIRIGWGATGDLTQLSPRSAQEISREIWQVYPGLTNFRFGGSSLWRFYHEVQLGDLVIVSSKQGKQLTVEVTGPYQWQLIQPSLPLTPDYQHYRTVRLTSLDPNTVFAQAGGMAPGENSRWALFRCARPIIP